ncbi:MAG: YggT family protein [Micrococcales bacterium]
MSMLVFVLQWALQIYFYLMIARLVADLVLSVNPSWRPRGLILVLVELIYTLTDPPIKLIRRFIKPLRFGGIALDFGWTIVVFAIGLLQSLLGRLL